MFPERTDFMNIISPRITQIQLYSNQLLNYRIQKKSQPFMIIYYGGKNDNPSLLIYFDLSHRVLISN